MFDQGRGFERGEGREFAIPLMAFVLHTRHRHIHHILTFHTSGDTWPAAFYYKYMLKYPGKGEKLLLVSNFSSYPQYFVT